MLESLRRRLSYGNVCATLALFLALGGTSYAITITGGQVRNSSLTGKDVKNSSLAGRDVKNSSLAGRDVKNSSLGGADVKSNSLTGADVKNLTSGDITNGTLDADDFKAGELSAGAQGPQGEQGPAGQDATSLWAVVEADGTLVRGEGAVSSQQSSPPGDWLVEFNQDVSQCAYLITPGETDAAGTTAASFTTGARALGEADSVFVSAFDPAGAEIDVPFHIAVFC